MSPHAASIQRLIHRCRWLALIDVLLVAAIVAYAAHRGYGLSRLLTKPPPPVAKPAAGPAAIVNGSPISDAVFTRALNVLHGWKTLDSLIDLALLEQEATRRGMRLDLARASGGVAEETRFLVRQLTLTGVPEARLRQLYELFKAELTPYSLAFILVDSRPEAQIVLHELQAGASFDALARRYSLDAGTRNRGGSLGDMDVDQIKDRWGDEAARTVQSLGSAGVTAPCRATSGFVIFRVTQVRGSFEDLRPRLEELLASAGQKLLQVQLRQAATITSSVPAVKRRLASLRPGSDATGPKGSPGGAFPIPAATVPQ